MVRSTSWSLDKEPTRDVQVMDLGMCNMQLYCSCGFHIIFLIIADQQNASIGLDDVKD